MIKKVAKSTLYSLLGVAIICAGLYLYDEYQESTLKSLELSFHTKHKWEWEDEYSRVQIRYVEDINRLALRKVHMDENYIVYAYKNDDHTLSTTAVFPAKCKPNTVITTTDKFPSGEPKILTCGSDGEALIYQVYWATKEPVTSWSENLDGYRIDESFYSWNFDKLDREITLNRAK